MRKQLAFFSLLFASLCTSANANVFMADTFSYEDGQLTDSDATETMTGDNVGGGNWVAHSGDTFDDNIDIIDGAAEVLASGSEDVNRLTGVTMEAGQTWYYAANVTVNDIRVDPSSEAINNDYFIHFKDNGFGFRGRTYVDEPNANDDPNTSSDTTFTFGLSSSSGGQQIKWAQDLDFGTQYTIVAEYDFDSGNSRLWVDPTNIESTSIMDPNPNENSPMFAINSLALRQDFLGGTPNNQVLVDNVSIGDDFDDVLAALGTDVSPNADVDVDLDDDGDVDGNDFVLIQQSDPSLIAEWQAQFGSTAGSELSAGTVPEPSTVALLCFAIGMISTARRHGG